MHTIYNNMIFSNNEAVKLYKMIEHLSPDIDISKPIESRDIMNIIKELSQQGYKFPEQDTFFYNLNNKYILYRFRNNEQFKKDCKIYTFSTLGWNDNYTYLRNDINNNFICVGGK